MNRRDYLAAVATGALASLSGCASSAAAVEPPGVRDRGTAGTERSDDDWRCIKEDPDRLYLVDGVGSVQGLTLETDRSTYERGDAMTVTLTNESDRTIDVGRKERYDVQRRVDGEWQSIFYGRFGVRVFVGDSLPPGDEIQWELRLTAKALSRRDRGTLMVCEPIQPGRYRFAHVGHDVDEDANAVATEFEVVEDDE